MYIHLGRQAGPLILYAVNWIVVSMVLGGGGGGSRLHGGL